MRGWEHLTTTEALALGRKPPKYRNTKVTIDGYGFDSKREGQRYVELTLMQRAGHIRDLELQVPYDLYGANGERVAQYVADFRYFSVEQQRVIVEDVKGGKATRTRLYLLKRKLLRAQGIDITEV